ncbi:MAG: peroxiredoxin [Burkholderiales bacterium]
MQRSDNLYELPKGLPVPADDGACVHLTGLRVPSVTLPSTRGDRIDLAAIEGRTVVYCYPRTGRPEEPSPGGWNEIPGARGCTPQSCAFRDQHDEIRALGIDAVYGLSAQDTDYQREAVDRLRLPFALLSDAHLEFARALKLPTFEVEGMTLLKRVTLILHNGVVEQVFYPVFPPDSNAQAVIMWLVERSGH